MRMLRLAALLELARRACGATTAPFIPLSAVAWDGGINLAVSVSLVAPDGTALPAQQLALLTDYSTVAFCNRTLGERVAQETVSVSETKVVSCTYGPDDGEAEGDGYWGYLYQGTVQLGQSQQSVVVKSAFYTVMEAQTGMCNENFHGFFGIAYKAVDRAYLYSDELPQWTALGVCPTRGAFPTPPLVQLLKEDPAAPRLLGLYWSGHVGQEAGELYINSAATANPRYTAGQLVGSASLATFEWYNVDVRQIALSIPGGAHAASGAGSWTNISCNVDGACTIDPGQPRLVVPRQIMTVIAELRNSSRPLGTISFTLGSTAGGAPVELGFDLATLLERGWISAAKGTEISLGLPLWASYYTAFDLAAGMVTFVSPPTGEPATAAAPHAAPGGGARRLRGEAGTFV